MNEILTFIYESKVIKSSAKKITKGDDLYNDLISELILIVSEMDLDFVKNLYKKNELEIYCYKIMYYQYTQPHMPFYKKYRSFETSINYISEPEVENIDEKYSNVMKIINRIEKRIAQKRYPAAIRLLELYVEQESYRKVGKEVGIAFKTVQYMVKDLTEKIRKEYDSTYNC